MSDTLTADCNHCGAPVRAADNTPDDTVIICEGCGVELGTYREIINAITSAGVDLYKKELSKMIGKINRK